MVAAEMQFSILSIAVSLINILNNIFPSEGRAPALGALPFIRACLESWSANCRAGRQSQEQRQLHERR